MGAMEANARQMASIERQHSEAQREVEIVEKEVDVEELMRDISRSKYKLKFPLFFNCTE